jgi:hypothetical protein
MYVLSQLFLPLSYADVGAEMVLILMLTEVWYFLLEDIPNIPNYERGFKRWPYNHESLNFYHPPSCIIVIFQTHPSLPFNSK